MKPAWLLAWAMATTPLAAQQAPAPSPPLPRVALDTTAGRIVIEADTAHAPIMAGNFLKYVDGHRLDGVVFYRAVKVADQFGFVQFGPGAQGFGHAESLRPSSQISMYDGRSAALVWR